MTAEQTEPAAPMHVPAHLLAAAPQAIPGCSECQRYRRVIEALREDRSIQTDARVLLSRHLVEEHQA